MSDWSDSTNELGDSYVVTNFSRLPDGSYLYTNSEGDIIGGSNLDFGLTGNYAGAGSGALPANQYANVGNPTLGQTISRLASSMGSGAFNALKGAFTKTDGTTDWGKLIGAAGGLAAGLGLLGGGDDKPKGYQGKIPDLAVAREQVANTYDPNRRAGSGGQRYFTDTQYVPQGGTDVAADASALTAAKTAAGTQATGLASLNTANPARQATSPLKFAPLPATPVATTPGTATTTPAAATATAAAPASDVIKSLPVPTYNMGGIATLAHGRYLDGPTDGMADKLPANIDGKQEARLSHGEFVIPADVVGHLGNGNSTAGAERLYAMMDRIRQARTGTKKQGKQINPDKYTPA
jgi:hypothetical protein